MTKEDNDESIIDVFNFEDLTQAVRKINQGWKTRWNMEPPGLSFRGASSYAYKLNPSLLRHPYPQTDCHDLAFIEAQLWVEISLRSRALLGYQIDKALNAMSIMQHHGLPTRLLDWSTSLAVAAYFAVREVNNKDDGAIWVMASRHLMELRGKTGWHTFMGAPGTNELNIRINPEQQLVDDGYEEFNKQTPLPIQPYQINQRIIAQKSMYTLHSFEKDSLETLARNDQIEHEGKCFLRKVRIPNERKAKFRSDLLVLTGTTEDYLFPDIDGFARSFKIQAEEDLNRMLGQRNSSF